MLIDEVILQKKIKSKIPEFTKNYTNKHTNLDEK